MRPRSETSFIQQIRNMAGRRHESVIQSIGDDCAILRPPAGRDLVFTTDLVLENRHFTLDTHTPAEIGHKALARSLSDLAAMGAQPIFCLVSLGVPSRLSARFIPAFYKGLLALARQHGVSLAGGDLAQYANVVADVMCCGAVPKGKALLRSTAKAGDSIYVSGELGGSALGFRSQRGAAWKRHRSPIPRLGVGLALRDFGVRCAMDISDGLSLDLSRLCTESAVSAVLISPLPVATGATLDEALHGGEDYELMFTAPRRKKIPEQVAGIPVTKIGEIVSRRRIGITLDGKPLAKRGFDHFA